MFGGGNKGRKRSLRTYLNLLRSQYMPKSEKSRNHIKSKLFMNREAIPKEIFKRNEVTASGEQESKVGRVRAGGCCFSL